MKPMIPVTIKMPDVLKRSLRDEAKRQEGIMGRRITVSSIATSILWKWFLDNQRRETI